MNRFILTLLLFSLSACSGVLVLPIENVPDQAVQTALDWVRSRIYVRSIQDSGSIFYPTELEVFGSIELELNKFDLQRGVIGQWCIAVKKPVYHVAQDLTVIEKGVYLVTQSNEGWTARPITFPKGTFVYDWSVRQWWDHCITL